MLELDQAGNVISYEEYHPYGSTAFHAADGAVEVSAKRYRYTGKERDEETGLYYHGARYYAPWLGRWTSADPLGIGQPGRPDPNLYAYVAGRPTSLTDSTGKDPDQPGFSFWTYLIGRRASPRSPADVAAEHRSMAPRPASREPESRPKPDPRPTRSESAPKESGYVESRSAFEQWWGLAKIWEGGYVNDPNDRGGATKGGLTLETARRVLGRPKLTEGELAALPDSTIRDAAQRLYRSWGVERVQSTAIRGMFADILWGGYNESALNRALVAAGYTGSPVHLEQPAGKMSDAMVRAINSLDPERLTDALYEEYRKVRESNASAPNQSGYRTGWLQRLGSFYIQSKLAIGGGAANRAATWYWRQSEADRVGIGARLNREQNAFLQKSRPQEEKK
jgi:RHS repeat-associated protein